MKNIFRLLGLTLFHKNLFSDSVLRPLRGGSSIGQTGLLLTLFIYTDY